MSGFTGLGAAELGRLLRRGRLDAVEVAQAFLARIDESADPAVFVTVTRERALKEARAARRRLRAGRPRSPLDGVPVAWKDVAAMAGTVTGMGSRLYAKTPAAAADAPLVRNLAAAGMVALGKTGMPEFCYSGLGANPHYGTPKNPRDAVRHRFCGGSSSGSAAAVAGGLAPVAIGTDTAGSVRIPAAWCGLAGYHASYGRLDTAGILPLAPSLDSPGVLAHAVADCMLVERALRGVSAAPVRRMALPRLTILVPDNEVHDGVADDIAANFEASLQALSRAGARIVRKPLVSFTRAREAERRHGRMLAVEGYAVHRADLEGPDAHLIDPFIADRFLKAASVAAADYLAVQQARRDLSRLLMEEMEGCDVIAYPTVRETAPLVDDPAPPAQPSINTQFGNFFSLCGLALPDGEDRHGLPTSLCLAARNGADDRLFAAGLAVERVLG